MRPYRPSNITLGYCIHIRLPGKWLKNELFGYAKMPLAGLA